MKKILLFVFGLMLLFPSQVFASGGEDQQLNEDSAQIDAWQHSSGYQFPEIHQSSTNWEFPEIHQSKNHPDLQEDPAFKAKVDQTQGMINKQLGIFNGMHIPGAPDLSLNSGDTQGFLDQILNFFQNHSSPTGDQATSTNSNVANPGAGYFGYFTNLNLPPMPTFDNLFSFGQ